MIDHSMAPTGEHNGYKLGLKKNNSILPRFKHLLASGLLQAVPDPGGIIDYSGQLPPVRDQGQRGSCFAFAWTGLLMFLQRQMGKGLPALSEAYFYSKCKGADGSPNEDGSDNGTGSMIAKTYGACLETLLPYSALSSLPSPKFPKTTSAEDQAAAPYKCTGNPTFVLHNNDSTRANAQYLLRQALLQFGPMVMGIDVYESFQPNAKGQIPIPGSDPNAMDAFRGGHDIILCGHDPVLGFKFENSWGIGWGLNGFAYLMNGWETGSVSPTGNMSDVQYFLSETIVGIDLGEPAVKPDVVATGLTIVDAQVVKITVGASNLVADGKSVALDQPAFVTNDTNRMMVPVHAAANQFGRSVSWDETTQTATFTKIV
jgi:hypothetical protein